MPLLYACEFFLCFLLLENVFLFSVLFQIRSVSVYVAVSVEVI